MQNKQTGKYNLPYMKYVLIGILSNQNDYRVSWAINRELQISLTKYSEPLSNQKENKETETTFPSVLYTYRHPDTMRTFLLYPGKNTSRQPIIKKLKNTDFILHIIGDTYSSHIAHLIKKLRAISIINLAFPIEPEKLSKHEKNIFDKLCALH